MQGWGGSCRGGVGHSGVGENKKCYSYLSQIENDAQLM